MKTTRKLIPALAMLLISAVMMSTASFAWFSMNGEVTANGMSVTATTPASLEIATTSTGGWAYSAALSTDVTNLNPITYFETDGKWYVPASTNKINADGSATTPLTTDSITAGAWTEVDFLTDDDSDGVLGEVGTYNYALVKDLYFRTNVGKADGATPIAFGAQATKTGASELLPGVKVYIYDGTDVVDITDAKAGAWTAPLSSADPAYVKLTVIVVYDGQNAAVKNDNADLVKTAISIDFTKN